MAQQINLYSPILLTPRRHFSALAMAQALAALAAGLVAFAAWSTWSTATLKQDVAAAERANDREKQAVAAELARRPALPTDTAALQQELAAARSALAARQAVRDELAAGRPAAGADHTTLLRLLAQTLPPSMWLTEVRRRPGRLEIAGLTRQPEALRPWLAQLAAHPVAAGLALNAVKVERSADGADAGGEAWSFRVVSGAAAGDGR
jgi:Tfp pilus assembly protein PilN